MLLIYCIIQQLFQFFYYFYAKTFLVIYSALYSSKKEHALYYYEQYLPLFENLIERVRANQHGYNNNIQSLIYLAETEKDYDSLSHSLIKYAKNLRLKTIPSSLLSLENKLLAGLLYCKYCQAEEKGITLEISIKNTMCQSYANEFELIDATGILLDNALENSSAGDTVYITIQKDRGREKPRFHLTVENPASITVNEEFIHNIFSKGYTTKTTDTENHGIGLHALKQIANKHHGSIIVKNT